MPVEARNDIVLPVAETTGQTKAICRVCGCSDDDACYHDEHGNCWWVEIDLCSHCKLYTGEAQRWSRLIN